MVLAGACGATLAATPEGIPPHLFWFGEEQARYVLAVVDPFELVIAAGAAGVSACPIGTTPPPHAPGADHLTLPDATTISLDELRDTHERFFPAWMGS
jgi:phosphoribosylformylglycinamidine synthase